MQRVASNHSTGTADRGSCSEPHCAGCLHNVHDHVERPPPRHPKRGQLLKLGVDLALRHSVRVLRQFGGAPGHLTDVRDQELGGLVEDRDLLERRHIVAKAVEEVVANDDR
jgi:hypothetical protein